MLAAYAARITRTTRSPPWRSASARTRTPRTAGRRCGPHGRAEPPRRLVAKGVGLPADRLPMILGCDGAGVDADGNEVIVHAVVPSDGLDRRRDPRPATDAPVGAPRRHAGRAGRRAGGQRRAEAGGYAVGDGRLPLRRPG